MNHPVSPEPTRAQLTAVRKEAFTQAQFINRLKTVLLVVVLLAAGSCLAYYAGQKSAGAPAAPRLLNDKETQHRIIALEAEPQRLKADLVPAKETNPVVDGFLAMVKLAIDNWVLLSFCTAVVTAAFVKYRFDIDYFESYRDVSTKKKLSEFYRKLGDRLMIYGEWESAEAAYRTSLEINPTNMQASYGVAKAGLFQPLAGQKYYSPDMAEAKLDHLIREMPADPQLVFLKGFNRFMQGDEQTSRALFAEAITLDPQFVGSHIQLGYLCMGAGETAAAITHFKTALELDPSYSLTNNNLGYCYLITLQLDQAIKCLDLSLKICPNLLSTISLGDAYRLNGDLAGALRLHEHAARVLHEKGIDKERYVGGAWLYNFMPLKKDDTTTIQESVRVSTFEQKKMVALCALAFDQALGGDLTLAGKTFAQAQALDKDGEYRRFIANKIQSILNLLSVPAPARAWFEAKLHQLTTPPPVSG